MEDYVKKGKDFSNGSVYCIRNWIDDDVYVGSTCQPLSKRFFVHWRHLKDDNYSQMKLCTKMKDLGEEHFYIELIEKVECENIEELRRKEGEYIRTMGTLNERVAGRSKRQFALERKEQNKATRQTKLQEEMPKRRKQHAEYKRMWAKNNEDRVKQNQQRFFDKIKNDETYKSRQCECGGSFTWLHKQRHSRTKRHQQYLQTLSN